MRAQDNEQHCQKNLKVKLTLQTKLISTSNSPSISVNTFRGKHTWAGQRRKQEHFTPHIQRLHDCWALAGLTVRGLTKIRSVLMHSVCLCGGVNMLFQYIKWERSNLIKWQHPHPKALHLPQHLQTWQSDLGLSSSSLQCVWIVLDYYPENQSSQKRSISNGEKEHLNWGI